MQLSIVSMDSKDEWLALQERIGEQVEELKNLRKEE